MGIVLNQQSSDDCLLRNIVPTSHGAIVTTAELYMLLLVKFDEQTYMCWDFIRQRSADDACVHTRSQADAYSLMSAM